MHFSKTYTQLLLSLPPELRANAIEYRQLKKLIKEVVDELAALGLNPDILHRVLLATTSGDFQTSSTSSAPRNEIDDENKEMKSEPLSSPTDLAELAELLGPGTPETTRVQVLYEFNVHEDKIEPRLRLRVGFIQEGGPEVSGVEELPDPPIDASSDKRASPSEARESEAPANPDDTAPEVLDNESNLHSQWQREYLIPLPADSAFFQLLSTALQTLSSNLTTVRSDFLAELDEVSRAISHAARPVSEASASSFHAHSHLANPADIEVTGLPGSSLITLARHSKSDLYTWRGIFQLYMDAEIFQGVGEQSRGDRPVEEAEERLNKFVERLNQSGLVDGKSLVLKESKQAIRSFLQLNLDLLNIKKLQHANTEAIRKILKKHAKRTALPLPLGAWTAPGSTEARDLSYPASPTILVSSTPLEAITLFPKTATSLPRMLVQAIGETLLPIIPSVDDYACLICTSLAFKPIRLSCGHLFCVRCLVKLQKKNKGNCPICRSPTVLSADRSNVDWALLNFMKDWFPLEAKEKLKQNEREAAQEEMAELGFNVQDSGCLIA